MSDLSEGQRRSLDEFQSITASEDANAARDALEAHDWHLESAVSSVYDQPEHNNNNSASDPLMSHHSGRGSVPPAGAFSRSFSQPFSNPHNNNTSTPFKVLLLPFYWLFRLGFSLLAFIFTRIIPIRPNLPSFSFHLNLFNTNTTTTRVNSEMDPMNACEATISELDSDLARQSHLHTPPTASSTATATTSSQGEHSAVRLPELTVSSYAGALSRCKSSLSPLLIVLYSAEHEHYPDFLRILSDPQLQQCLQQEQLMVWIGHAKYADAFAASSSLEASAFPFYAFVTPAAPSASSVSAQPLVFSRLEGAHVSAQDLVTHTTSIFLPRIKPTLTRLTREKQHREAERRMREEQEEAYQQAARQDLARMAKREEALKQEKLQQDRVQAEQAEAHRRAQWRGWLKTTLVPEATQGARVSVKLPDGRTLVRRFDSQTQLKSVYAWVECAALPCAEGWTSEKGYDHEFKLVQLFPKQTLGEMGHTLGQVGLERGGNLVVEGLKLPSKDDEEEDEEEEEEEEE